MPSRDNGTRKNTECRGHPCQPLACRYAIILIVLLSPTPTNVLTLTGLDSHAVITRCEPHPSNRPKMPALPNSFLRSSWTSDQESKEKQHVNQNAPGALIGISERCLFHRVTNSFPLARNRAYCIPSILALTGRGNDQSRDSSLRSRMTQGRERVAGTAARHTGEFCLDMKWGMTHTGFMLNGDCVHKSREA